MNYGDEQHRLLEIMVLVSEPFHETMIMIKVRGAAAAAAIVSIGIDHSPCGSIGESISIADF